MSCKQVIPSCGSQNCILFVFVFFKMVILRWVAVNMLLTNRKHSRPFFKIFFDIEVSKVRPKLTFMRKKKEIYIWTPLCHIFYVVIKKIFHSYLINDKVQSKLDLILLSLLLQSLFFLFFCYQEWIYFTKKTAKFNLLLEVVMDTSILWRY